MKKNEKDSFVGLEKNVFQNDNNFFLMEETPDLLKLNQPVSDSVRRLNDYDFNLLREDAYKDVSDDLFKLEYKISRIEGEIKDLDNQIKAANEISEVELIEDLSFRKKALEDELEALLAIYNDKSLSAKISDKILSFFGANLKKELSIFQSKISNVSDVILSKMPKQFSSIIELRKSLAKLENLNKSVDDLMSLNIPYGENYNKYEQLSKYIIKANSIQSEISQYFNK